MPDDHISRNILQEIQDDIYIEMKNYLEKGIAGEDDEDDERNDKHSSDQQSSEKQPNDKQLKQPNERQLDDKLNGPLSKQANSSEQLADQKELNNNSLKNAYQPTATDLTMEELDQQDKFSETVQLSKRNLKSGSGGSSNELNAVRKVKMFYRSCMNESTVNDEPTSVNVILNLIYEYGGEWSLLSRTSHLNKTFKQIRSIQSPTYRFDTKKPMKNKLETRIFSVFLHQIQPIFHFYVAPEEFKRNSKDYAIHVSLLSRSDARAPD